MIQRLKKLIATLSLGSLLVMPVFAPAAVMAQDCLDDPNGGGIDTCLQAGSCSTDPEGCEGEDSSDQIQEMITLIINILSVIIGVVSVIMIIIGGAKYITSGGNDSNVASAKNTIMYAIIGLVFVALAQLIVNFVLEKVSGV